MIKKSRKGQRTKQQLQEHYEIEMGLADRLRNTSRKERLTLYASLYEELYRLVPHHPQLTRKVSPDRRQKIIKNQMKLLARLLDKNMSFLEIGPGDCALALEVAKFVRRVYAIDVSETITKNSHPPENFQLILSDGCTIPVPKNSIDVAYSNQLMEHLHPDDAFDQLQNIFNVLAPGGVYLCITPNRLNGPHDISKHFGTIARGFHLKEYTITELSSLFKKVGFSKVFMYIGGRGKYAKFPILPAILCESLLELLPNTLKQRVANTILIKQLISIKLIGIKGTN